MMVIGMTGFARCGKDTVADYLVKHHGFQKRRFSDPLKAMLRRLNPIVDVEWNEDWTRVEDLYAEYGDEEGIKDSRYGDEMRGLWQRLGTDCVRAVDDQFWVRAAMQTLTDPDGRYVFTDCRFPNEAEAVRNMYGQLWHIQREGVGAVNGHASEQHAGQMGEDVTIANNGTLSDLFDQVEHILLGSPPLCSGENHRGMFRQGSASHA